MEEDDERSDVELFRAGQRKPAARSAQQEEGLWSSVLKRFGRNAAPADDKL